MSEYQSLNMNAALEKKRLRERRSKILVRSALTMRVC